MKRRLLLATLLAWGCSRDAEIYDEPDASLSPTAPNQDVIIPSVPGLELDGEASTECLERPEGPCRGSNDFFCAFDGYAAQVINDCFRSNSCQASGWVSLTLDENGCLSDIGMDSVDDAFVACLVDMVGKVRCPCANATFKLFLGVDSESCEQDEGPRG